MSQQNLTTEEAAAVLRVSAGTLANWRVTGKGPKYAKFGSRVLYPADELDRWQQSKLQRNTGENE